MSSGEVAQGFSPASESRPEGLGYAESDGLRVDVIVEGEAIASAEGPNKKEEGPAA